MCRGHPAREAHVYQGKNTKANYPQNDFKFAFKKQVYTEGRLIVEFTFDDMMRIRSWHFAVRNHRELIPRSILGMQEPGMIESLSKNITRQGLTNTTLNYLRVSKTIEKSSDIRKDKKEGHYWFSYAW